VDAALNAIGLFAVALRVIGLALVAIALGCTSVPQKLDPKVFYKRDMILDVDGHRGTGTLVVPRRERYRVSVEARGKLDLFTFTTCHRELVRERAWDSWLKKKKAKVDYVPVPGLEDAPACPVELGGYERIKGRHSWALLDMEDPQTTLPAVVKCNGGVYNSRGVTVCQSRAGLLQEITFPSAVRVSPDAGCELRPSKNNRVFLFDMPRRKCVYLFRERAAGRREHRLTTLGYESILIRED
jgi:hypothetical protein